MKQEARLTTRPRARALLAVAVSAQVVLGACAPAAPASPTTPGSASGQGASGASATGGTTSSAPAAPAAPVVSAPTGSGLVGVARAASLPAPTGALSAARVRLLDGDYVKASQEFAGIQANYPGTAEAADALFYQSEALLNDDQHAASEEHLRRFLALYPEHSHRAVATLMLGRALEAQGNGGAAITAYRQYEAWAAPGASLADVVNLKAAQIYFASDRPADAWAALAQASGASEQSPSNSARVRLFDELATRYWNGGDRARAVEARRVAFEAAVASARPASQVTTVAWRYVSALQETGQRAQADAIRRRIVNDWPRTATALQAMGELGPDSVAPFRRATIYFANRRWQNVVPLLTDYVNSGQADAEGTTAEARYMRAVALTRLGNDDALSSLDRILERHSNTEWADDALWEAGSLLLRRGDRASAAARFEQLAVTYPTSEYRGQALVWLGKILPEQGNPTGGARYMEAAASASHEDFYTFRARAAVRRPSPAPKPLADQVAISDAERAAWTEWLGQRGYTPDAQAAKRAEIEADGRFQRGTALLDAGLRKEAEEEFLEIARTQRYHPVAVEHVAVHVRERGFYPLSVTLGHQLVETIEELGEPSLLNAPRVAQKLVLPLAFISLVEPAAKAKGLDPLLMLGLMKQESWFEPRASSTAQARGLTQFIRETATSVSRELNWPNWTWDDMNRPYVSVPFGAHYLSSLIKDFRGNTYFATAGYNGGPGNVMRWAKGDWNVSPEAFAEGIDYSETRGYVKAVSGNHELYKAIYYR